MQKVNIIFSYLFLHNFIELVIFIIKYRCRVKIHKDHIDNNDPLTPCKLNHDPNMARDMLLLATSTEDQNKWVSRLSRRIQKSGYKANSGTTNDGLKMLSR